MIGMWSLTHFAFIFVPYIVLIILYFVLRHRSDKAKYIIGVIIGSLSLIVILVRMISYFVDYGFTPHSLPIQICHFGNIVVFLSLVFKSRTWATVAWGLNLFPAIFAIINATVLNSYPFWYLRAQTFMWGHALIVIGAIYPVMLKMIKFDFKSLINCLVVVTCLAVVSMILNNVFNSFFREFGTVNYFNFVNYSNFPLFAIFYNPAYNVVYNGWFKINWPYAIGVFLSQLALAYIFYLIEKLFYLKNKNYKTLNVFEERKLKRGKGGIIE